MVQDWTNQSAVICNKNNKFVAKPANIVVNKFNKIVSEGSRGSSAVMERPSKVVMRRWFA